MSPLYPYNDWSDINIYFTVGKSIFNGRVLYTEIFDHKGPLIFFIYGLAYLISNTTFIGMFLFEIVAMAFMKRSFNFYCYYPIGMSGILLGMFYFPFGMIKNIVGKIALSLSAIALFIVIFITDAFYTYYPLPLHIFMLPFLIVTGYYLSRYIALRFSKTLIVIVLIFCVLIGVNAKTFFDLESGVLLRSKKPNDVITAFGEIIAKEKKPTLLLLGHGLCNALFTVNNIVPNTKYFFIPNLPEKQYPELNKSLTEYIENKETKFIALNNDVYNYAYFEALPALKNNYTIVSTYQDKAPLFNGSPLKKMYFLYKRKNE